MNLMFVGDPHGLHEHIVEAIENKRPSACMLLGDQCYDQPIDQLFAGIDGKTAFHWIHGNHDTDRPGWYANLFDSPWSSRNLHGRVEQFTSTSGNLRVAGLGGVCLLRGNSLPQQAVGLHKSINGFCLWYKRLEKHRFHIPEQISGGSIELSSDHLSWLLGGLNLSAPSTTEFFHRHVG